jgi:hypothetical protein
LFQPEVRGNARQPYDSGAYSDQARRFAGPDLGLAAPVKSGYTTAVKRT